MAYPPGYLNMKEIDLMQKIDAAQLERALHNGAQLVDVREPGEYAEAHVPGAVLVPMGQLPGRLHELDRATPVHVICASGGRSSAMGDVLAAAGFDVVNVAGGTQGWISSGRPVDSGLR